MSDDGAAPRPKLILFYSKRSGPSRRAQGFLAQVLQRRRNHDTFDLILIAREERPDLFERFKVDIEPTLIVVDGKAVRARLAPVTGAEDVRKTLAPWLH
jgi:thioredoxin-like negative regulator of GroEL